MTANVSASNSTSLYQTTGNVNIGQSTVSQILGYFDNNGNVNFALDPATGNNQIKAYFVGTATGSSYGNANVADFLPTYTGLLAPSSIFTNNYYFANGQPFNPGTTYSNANVAAYLITNTGNIQAGNVTVLGNLTVAGTTTTTYTANLTYGTVIANSTTAATSTTTGALQSYGGLGVQGNIWGAALYSNNYYYANGQPFLGSTIATLQSNAATQAVAINSITANLGAYQTWANANIQSISANLGAFETYANTRFYSNANVTAFLPGYTGILRNLGAIYTDQYYFANGVPLVTGGTGGSTYGNANVAEFLPTYGGTINSFTIFNDSGFAIQGRDYTQMQFTNGVTPPASEYDIGVGAWFYIDAGGGVFQSNTTGNLKTILYGHDATITADGNIAAPYFIGDGSQLTNLPIQAGTYSNSNVASYLPTYSGSLENSSSIINLWSNAATQATSINTLTANAATQAGQISVLDANLGTATTNITTLFGNAATQQTSIDSLSANAATQAGQIAVLDANLGTATTNITTLFANAATQATAINTLTANAATQAGQIATLDANLGTATTNITTLFANAASQATDITTLYANAATQSIAIGSLATGANANTAAYLPGYTGDLNSLGNVTVLGSLTSDDITSLSVYVQGNAIITGNLTVLGNTTTINSNTITTNDKNITVANNVTVVSQLDGAGLDAGQNSYATWRYNYLTDSWQSNLSVTPTTDATKNLGGVSNRWGTVYAQTLVSATIDTINANLGTATTNITTLFANAATQAGQIAVLDANLGTATTNITTLFANAATQSIAIGTINANLGAYQTYANANIGTISNNLQTLNANVGAYETWANTAISNAYFNGNLAGNTLIDSVRGRVFANASPDSQGNVQAGGLSNVLMTFANVPAYIGGTLQPPPTGGLSTQYVSFIQSANIGLQGSYGSSGIPRTTGSSMFYAQITPVTANVMYNNDRIRGHNHTVELVNSGTLWGTMNSGSNASTNMVATNNVMNILGYGNINQVIGTTSFVQNVPWNGSSNVQYATGVWSDVTNVLNAGSNALPSNIAYARMYSGRVNAQANLTITNGIALHTSSNWWGVTGVTNKYVVLNEDANSVIQTNGDLTVTRNANIGGYNSTQTNISGNTYILASNLWVSGSNLQVNSTYYNFPGNGKFGAPGSTGDFTGNVNFNSPPPYNVTFFGNVVQGVTGSYIQLRGTTKVQGNILFDAPYYETITALGNQSGTLTINTGICNTFTMTLTGDITINTTSFTNMITGKSITLILTQDGTGGRTLTSNMKFAGGISSLSAGIGAIDVLNIYYDGTNYLASLVKGYV
jgi:hypothetical protein